MLKRADPTARAPEETAVLITAAEVYPELERAFLSAQREIWGSFRVFDLWTRLRSEEAREIGDTWFDLVVHTLQRGVAINMVLSDFDAIMAPELHSATWCSMRAFLAAGEVAGPDAPLKVTAAAHPARVGRPHRLLFWPLVYRRLRHILAKKNGLSADARERWLETMPGLRDNIERTDSGRLRAKAWPPADLFPATHHQKIAVFDRQSLYIGGLDLDERRYDDKKHDRRRDETWHDVQVFCNDPDFVREAQTHLETFLDVTAGIREPEKSRHLLKTLSRKRRLTTPFIGPKPLDTGLLEAHVNRVREAREMIYLETQFFRDSGFAEALAQAGRENPELGVVVVLPAAPEDVAFDNNSGLDARFGEYLQARAIDRVQDAFGERALFCSPVRPQRLDRPGRDTFAGSPIVYVHAKVSIFDRSSAIISSANLNARSFYWDTESGIEITSGETIDYLRRRVFKHWLGEEPGDDILSLQNCVAALRARCESNLEAAPEKRQGFLVPHDPEPGRRFGRNAPGLPEAMV